MFAIVRTGGKQYRVAADQKITVDRIDGEVGDRVALDDVLMMGEGADLKGSAKEVVHAEIVEQARSKKIKVFKKKRRQGYRRTRGHRQQLTVLKITGLGGKADAGNAAAAKKAGEETPTGKADAARTSGEGEAEAKKAPAKKSLTAKDGQAAAKTAPKAEPKKKAPAKKAAAGEKAAEDKSAADSGEE